MAESVTLAAVALPLLQTATSTMSRLPVVIAALGVSAKLAAVEEVALTPCTNAGEVDPAAPAVTATSAHASNAAVLAASSIRNALDPLRKRLIPINESTVTFLLGLCQRQPRDHPFRAMCRAR